MREQHSHWTAVDSNIPPYVKQDLQILADRMLDHPKDVHAKNLFTTAMNAMSDLQNGCPGTHDLEYMATYGDLSDCSTLYVGLPDDPMGPSHRIVFQDRSPEHAGDPIQRNIIAVGERDHGKVYHQAAQRLGRPPRMTLHELSQAREPIATQRQNPKPYQPAQFHRSQRDDQHQP